jgi:hypothetical protein
MATKIAKGSRCQCQCKPEAAPAKQPKVQENMWQCPNVLVQDDVSVRLALPGSQ